MTIDEAIAALADIKKRHDGKVLVYFDCPHCKIAFTPGQLEVEAIHITSDEKNKS